MRQAFVIMQIGNDELDEVYDKAILPAILSCNLSPKRVDKHNEGGLLKSEIISFIQKSDIIIADLTNERPNCYLEIGYAMGIDKFKSLLLTVREDHFPDNPKHIKGGPKVHFDLAGYDILTWSKENIELFKKELEKRINRRLLIISPTENSAILVWDDQWINKNRETATEAIKKMGYGGAMEIWFALNQPKLSKSQKELDEAARRSEIRKSGWPIGVYLNNVPEARPHPTADGIVAENSKNSYDYWAFNKSGDFYSLMSLYEDYSQKPEFLFYDKLVNKITEALLYCARFYSYFDMDSSHKVSFAFHLYGLKNRIISSYKTASILRQRYISIENEFEMIIEFQLSQIESDLVTLVKKIAAPLFELFDYYEVSDSLYEKLVHNFTHGQT